MLPLLGVQHWPVELWHICTWLPPDEIAVQLAVVRKTFLAATTWQVWARFHRQRFSTPGETQGVSSRAAFEAPRSSSGDRYV